MNKEEKVEAVEKILNNTVMSYILEKDGLTEEECKKELHLKLAKHILDEIQDS